MSFRHAFACAVLLVASTARASTGVCDSNPPTTTDACIAAVQSSGGVVNDVFHDTNGRTATQLPLFGQLFNQWPNCGDSSVDFAGCDGTDTAPYNCPGQYACATTIVQDFAHASSALNALDHHWWHPCRLSDDSLQPIDGGALCPNFATTNCIADGVGGHYDPWEGLVFDLGGPSNKVAIFAVNDHGPQPCESLEYTVFLTDNPYSTDEVLHPASDGVDPQKWNRAVLSQVFTHGWYDTRAADPANDAGFAACGDTADYPVEQDSFAQVFSLPCGITFRYAAIVAGNDGLDFPACAFDSQEAELDAVAGLTETGAAVCPDADGDHFVDCNCPGAPSICDCNDQDPSVHPGAPEACDSTVDQNCDGVLGSCSGNQLCYQSQCLSPCSTGELSSCPGGATCVNTAQGLLCVPQDCSSTGCPTGADCVGGRCIPSCTGVTCPLGQVCENGVCLDPCSQITCPSGQECHAGVCDVPCTCYATTVACAGQANTVCASSGTCVAPACQNVSCPQTEQCDPQAGICVGECTSAVQCPWGQYCVEGSGCVPLCAGVACDPGLTCDPGTGACVTADCVGVTCTAPLVCVSGTCTAPDGGGTSTSSTSTSGTTTGGTSTTTSTSGGTSTTTSTTSGGSGSSGSSSKGTANATSSGCGCGAGGFDASAMLALVSVLGLAARRRR